MVLVEVIVLSKLGSCQRLQGSLWEFDNTQAALIAQVVVERCQRLTAIEVFEFNSDRNGEGGH